MMDAVERWRGLKSMVQDTIEHGSRAVERLQKEAVKRPFELLEKVPSLQVPVRGIREIHDEVVSGVHGVIRLVNRVAGDTLDVVLDAVADRRVPEGEAPRDAKPEAAPQPERPPT